MVSMIKLPINRSLNWKVVCVLVVMQLVGNLASIPLYQETHERIEPITSYVFWTLISIPLIALALALACRVGLGAPLLEGYLTGPKIYAWWRRVLGLLLLMLVVGVIPFLVVNQNVNIETYPPLWTLLLASVQAGVREEIFMRLFIMSLLAWLGGRFKSDDDRPNSDVMWMAIILSGIFFGLAHTDNVPYSPVILGALMNIFFVNFMFGMFFGWLYWRLGIESAILAHFTIDAVGSVILVPVYFSGNFLLQLLVAAMLLVGGIVGLRLLKLELVNA